MRRGFSSSASLLQRSTSRLFRAPLVGHNRCDGRRCLEISAKKGAVSTSFSIKGEAIEGRSSFLDNQSTTPLDPRVLDAMLPLLTWQYGNPHSRSHHYGWEAEGAVEEARAHVGKLIGADAKEIIFTSGATECNNMAVKGVAHFY